MTKTKSGQQSLKTIFLESPAHCNSETGLGSDFGTRGLEKSAAEVDHRCGFTYRCEKHVKRGEVHRATEGAHKASE